MNPFLLLNLPVFHSRGQCGITKNKKQHNHPDSQKNTHFLHPSILLYHAFDSYDGWKMVLVYKKMPPLFASAFSIKSGHMGRHPYRSLAAAVMTSKG